MPSALDQFRTQQQQLPESQLGLEGRALADPYGRRGATTTQPNSTPPAPVSQTPPTTSTVPTNKPLIQEPVTPVTKPLPTTYNTGGTTPPNSGLPNGGVGTQGPSDNGSNNTPTFPTNPNNGQPPGGGGGVISNGPPSSFSPYNVVTNNLDNLLNSNSAYIRNARQRGMEAAAGRGLINSSIAAGSAQRAAIEGAMPILSQIMGLTSQRESQAFQQQFAQTQATLQDWANSRQFEREFNAQLALFPIASSADMWSSLMNLAAQDPTVFTPTVLAGYQDFFMGGFNEYIGRYLEGIGGGI